ncbi:hypothetical protein D9M70_560020 [compost metagenome]
MTIHVLERIELAIIGWHQLDDTLRGVIGNPCGLVQAGPAPVILLDIGGHVPDGPVQANTVH